MRLVSFLIAFSSIVACATPSNRYGDPAPPPLTPRPALAVSIEELIQRLAVLGKRPAPVVDTRLEAALQSLAGRARPGEAPDSPLIAEALWLRGIVEPLPYLLAVTAGSAGDAEVLEEVRTALAQVMADKEFRRVAASVTPSGPDRVEVLVALHESHVDVDAVPRQLPAGGTVAVSGRLLGPFTHAELFVSSPDGQVRQMPVTAQGARFSGPLACAHNGRQQVEIVAEGPRGSTVLANFPVYCGTPAPLALPAAGTLEDRHAPAWKDAAEAETRLLSLLNHDRAEAGLRPLAVDTNLEVVARAHSRDMRDANFVGHNSPTTGTPGDRTHRAGLTAVVLRENVAAASSPEQVERGLLDSPAHRANLLSPEVDRVGIGAVVGGSGEMRILYVTELYARIPAQLDAAGAAARLRQRIDAARASARLAPLMLDPELTQVASTVAHGLAAGTLTPEKSSAPVDAAAPGLAHRYASLRTLLVTTLEVDAFQVPASLLDRALTHAGLAAAPARKNGDAVFYLVMLVATHR